MMKIEIKIDVKTINFFSSNPTAKICLKVNDEYFPEKDWNDLIFVILKQWLQQICSIEQKVITKEKFYFLDGPFSFEIEKIDKDYFIELFVDGISIGKSRNFKWPAFYKSIKDESLIAVTVFSKLSSKENNDVESIIKVIHDM